MVVKPNIAIHTGMMRPPPPIPPLFAKPSKRGKIIMPPISSPFGGITLL
jgi:hypothetical protein